MTSQPPSPSKNKDPYAGILSVLALVLGLICLGLWGLAMFRAGYLPWVSTWLNLSVTPVVADTGMTCEELINKAMLVSGDHCARIGPNQVCYGNVTIQADLLPQAGGRFANVGDVVDVGLVKRLSTAPLDLQKNEWGIAVFNLIANLPRSLPGQAVKMVVFGNTTLGNNGVQDIQSFYFSSELGQIVCDKVPFDGIMITMPDGAGVRLMINGTELELSGNASIQATANGSMNVNMYTGTASVTADGQTQYVGAGQTVSVPLGGPNGTDAKGPPSPPSPLPTQQAGQACALAGINCPSATLIPTVNPADAQATLNSQATPSPTGGLPVSGSATAGPTPTSSLPPEVGNPTSTLPALPPTSSPLPPTAPPQPTNPPPQPTSPPQPTPKPVKTRETPPGQIKKTPKPTTGPSGDTSQPVNATKTPKK